jgi:hypothetical protein
MQIIRLTKLRQWYLPVDAESYKILRSAGIPLIRIQENFIPTIGMLTKKKKIKARLVDFNDTILNPYLDELGMRWQKKDHRKATINSSVLRFETVHASAAEQARLAVPKIEASLRRFFARWGYTATYELSESRGKIKFHVAYKYDPNKLPIINLQEDPTSLPVARIDLGYVRISLTMGEKELETNVSIATGTTWQSIHTSRCLYSQVSDVRQIVNTLMDIPSKDIHNFDNKIK